MDSSDGLNLNPTIHSSQKALKRTDKVSEEEDCDDPSEPFDALEVFDMLRHINDPEHPLTLEQLNVMQLDLIKVDDAKSTADILFTPTIPHCRSQIHPPFLTAGHRYTHHSSLQVTDILFTPPFLTAGHILFTPTIPHCSMATLIGLSIRVKLLRSLPSRFKVTVNITPGTHASEEAINKQLNDKERVAAALENEPLLKVLNKCIADSDPSEEGGDSAQKRMEVSQQQRFCSSWASELTCLPDGADPLAVRSDDDIQKLKITEIHLSKFSDFFARATDVKAIHLARLLPVNLRILSEPCFRLLELVIVE
eukprot:g76183.t1